MKTKVALITGINGQDGSYLAEFLLSKGYAIFGTGLEEKKDKFIPAEVVYQKVDITDTAAMVKIVKEKNIQEIYNLAGLSSVKTSFAKPDLAREINGYSVVRLLKEVGKISKESSRLKFFQASSSEMFGGVNAPQDENTPLVPKSPYAEGKVIAHQEVQRQRKENNLFICCGILFNHESPRRPENFVTRKITKTVAEINRGRADKLILGNLEARRDWGYAPEYMEAAWLMLQQDEPNDYVIGTGEAHTIREFTQKAFLAAGILDWEKYLQVDKDLFRTSEVSESRANPKKAKEILGWEPHTKFNDLVRLMVEADISS